jgi:transcriptional regulator with XRE-family HTH domain
MKPRARINNPQELGHALAQGRLMLGLSQRDLAKELGIEQKWVWEMEQGKPGLLTQRLFAMLKVNGMHLYAEYDALPGTAEEENVDE